MTAVNDSVDESLNRQPCLSEDSLSDYASDLGEDDTSPTSSSTSFEYSSQSSSEFLSEFSSNDEETVLSLVPRALPPDIAFFPSSPIAISEFNVAFLLFCQRHNLSYACRDDLLKLHSITHPTPNKILRSSHPLMKQFVDLVHSTTLLQQLPFTHSAKISMWLFCEIRTMFIHVPLTQQFVE